MSAASNSLVYRRFTNRVDSWRGCVDFAVREWVWSFGTQSCCFLAKCNTYRRLNKMADNLLSLVEGLQCTVFFSFSHRLLHSKMNSPLVIVKWASYVGLLCEMVSDTIIAVYMVLFLRKRRSSGFERSACFQMLFRCRYWPVCLCDLSTNSVVDFLIVYTVGTCALTV